MRRRRRNSNDRVGPEKVLKNAIIGLIEKVINSVVYNHIL